MGSHIFLPSRGRTTNNYETVEHHAQRKLAMSYYRYITGVYKSYWPELNRTLRSSSVPCRISRASSVPTSSFYSNSYFSRGTSATPFGERAMSVPRQLTYSYDTRCIVTPSPAHYTDFDYKVISYMNMLN